MHKQLRGPKNPQEPKSCQCLQLRLSMVGPLLLEWNFRSIWVTCLREVLAWRSRCRFAVAVLALSPTLPATAKDKYRVVDIVTKLRSIVPRVPDVGVICGSGLSELHEMLTVCACIVGICCPRWDDGRAIVLSVPASVC